MSHTTITVHKISSSHQNIINTYIIFFGENIWADIQLYNVSFIWYKILNVTLESTISSS